MNVVQGDLLLFAAGDEATVNRALDRVRQYIAKQLKLADPKAHALLWVTDFPMFEWNEEEQRHEALHHPFTAPNQVQAEQVGGDLRRAKALAYDLVYNGVEIGGKLPGFNAALAAWQHTCSMSSSMAAYTWHITGKKDSCPEKAESRCFIMIITTCLRLLLLSVGSFVVLQLVAVEQRNSKHASAHGQMLQTCPFCADATASASWPQKQCLPEACLISVTVRHFCRSQAAATQ